MVSFQWLVVRNGSVVDRDTGIPMKVIWKETEEKPVKTQQRILVTVVTSNREVFSSYLSPDTPPNRPFSPNKSSLVKMPLMAEVLIHSFQLPPKLRRGFF